MKFATLATVVCLSSSSSLQLVSAKAADEDKSKPGPPFFLIDTADQLCLAGEEFKRCSIDTLWYVKGESGNYQIHKRPADGVVDEQEDGDCLSVKSCKDADFAKAMDVKIAKCSHCGAKRWSILGEQETGYVLSEGDGRACLSREKGSTKAITAPCDSTEHRYAALHLQFASAGDIKTMSSEGARLIGAASDGDLKMIQDLLKSGVDVNARDWDELTALIPAASAGQLEICKFLVEKGIDVNAKDKDGITALMEASIMGHTDVVSFLLENGADVSETASSEVTALWLAASEGRVDVMKILLEKGADVLNSRVDGIAALMTAAVGGHADAVALLLENGADPLVEDKDGHTALINAAESGNVEVMRLLVEKAASADYVNHATPTGLSAIVMAAANGKAEALKFLIESGADANTAFGENQVTALMYAAASGHVDAVNVLVDSGKVDLEVKHSNGGTALLEAATAGMDETVKLLVEKGSDFVGGDSDGVTPLMAVASAGGDETLALLLESLKSKFNEQELKEYINTFSHSGGSAVMFAAAGGHVGCAKQLIALGADIHAIAKASHGYPEKLKMMIEAGQMVEDDSQVDGVTGLHVAAQHGHLEMVNLLISEGIDVNIKDEADRTALSLAVASNHADCAKVLIAGGADPNTLYVDDDGETHNLLFDAIMVENEEFALLLIEKGADIYHADDKKVTTLLQAAHRGLTDIVKALIEKNGGKDGFLDTASEDGISPLIAASSEGQLECVKLLIDAKADINAKDKDGTNAIMAASARGHVDVVTALLAAGANVNEQNTDGHTALMFAYNGKNQVETLFERYSQFVADGSVDDEEGTFPILKQAMESHKALIDVLLKNGADPKIKDKEGHIAKDFDYHPDTDAEILAKQVLAEKVKDESQNEL